MTLVRAAQTLTLVSLAWGILAFGGTYQWASRSLAVLVVLASAACWLASPRAKRWPKAIIVTMVFLLVAVGVQLVPLDQSTIVRLNPARHEMLRSLWLSYRFDPATRHALSIDPALTAWAMTFYGVLCVWVLSVAVLLTSTGVRWLVKGLTVLGVATAVFGIIQNAVYDGRVYGFWTPESEFATPFGPFINRNHFAGWMLMVLPLALAWLAFDLRRAAGTVRSDWRSRFLWLTSDQGSRSALLGVAGATMTLSIAATLSRSGVVCLFASMVFVVGFLLVGRLRWQVKLLFGAAPLILGVGALMWVGPAIFDRIGTLQTAGAEDRLTIWRDAISIGQPFSGMGIGLNTYGTATTIGPNRFRDVHVAQVHNDYLQLWVEGGVLLCIPALLLVGALVREAVKQFGRERELRWFRVAAIVGMSAVLMQEFVDFSLQMPGNLLVFATLVAIVIHGPRPASHGRESLRTGRRPSGAAADVVLAP